VELEVKKTQKHKRMVSGEFDERASMNSEIKFPCELGSIHQATDARKNHH
jgi:hypothetical protein